MSVNEITDRFSSLFLSDTTRPAVSLSTLPANILQLIANSSEDFRSFNALRRTCREIRTKLPLNCLISFAFFKHVCEAEPVKIRAFYTLLTKCPKIEQMGLLSTFFAQAHSFAQSLFWRHVILRGNIEAFLLAFEQIGPNIQQLHLGKIPFSSRVIQEKFEQTVLPRIVRCCKHLQVFEYEGVTNKQLMQFLLSLPRIAKIFLPPSVHAASLIQRSCPLRVVSLQTDGLGKKEKHELRVVREIALPEPTRFHGQTE